MSGKIGLTDFGVCWRIEKGFVDSRSRRERRDQRNILILPSDLSRQIIAFFCPRALFLLCSTFQKDWECFLESISTLLVPLSTQTEETPVTRERLIGMSFIEVFQHLPSTFWLLAMINLLVRPPLGNCQTRKKVQSPLR